MALPDQKPRTWVRCQPAIWYEGTLFWTIGCQGNTVAETSACREWQRRRYNPNEGDVWKMMRMFVSEKKICLLFLLLKNAPIIMANPLL